MTPFKNIYTSGARCGYEYVGVAAKEKLIEGGRFDWSRVVHSNFKYVQIAEDFIIDTDSCEYMSAAGHTEEIGSLLSDRICRLQSEKLFPDRILRVRAERTIESNGQSVGAQCATILLLN